MAMVPGFCAAAVALLGIGWAPAAAVADVGATSVVRIPLENYEQMQFFGRIGVGTPLQDFHVIFDTGSSDVWLPHSSCSVCAGVRRFRSSQSSTYQPTSNAFEIEYGSGNAAGSIMRDHLQLGAMELGNVSMGQVNRTTNRLQRFRADGIVGLAFESLALITANPGLFESVVVSNHSKSLLSRFSIFVNALPGALPSSELVLGGVAHELALAPGAEAVEWTYFPLINFPVGPAQGFWAVSLLQMTILDDDQNGDEIAQLSASMAAPASCMTTAEDAVAIVDSGTSLILLPPQVFAASMFAMQQHLAKGHQVALEKNADTISGYSCVRCSPSMFPSIAFTFDIASTPSRSQSQQKQPPHVLILDGADYVRCDGYVCTPQIDVHAMFEDSSEAPAGSPTARVQDVIILGAIFMRSFYTEFDVQQRRVGFACQRYNESNEETTASMVSSSSFCMGRRNVALQFPSRSILLAKGFGLLFWQRMYMGSMLAMAMFAAGLMYSMMLTSRDERRRSASKSPPPSSPRHRQDQPEPERRPSIDECPDYDDPVVIASIAWRKSICLLG